MVDYLEETQHSATAIKIMRTAERLFMQRGFRAVSVNDIVHAAEVTKPTLYYHFADKEELFVQMTLHMLATMHSDMDAALEGKHDIAGRLGALAEVLLRSTDGDMQMMRREIQEHLDEARQQRLNAAFRRHLVEPVRAVMQEGLDRGELAPFGALELAMLFLGLISAFQSPRQGTREPSYGGAAPLPTSFPPDTLVRVFLHGVTAP